MFNFLRSLFSSGIPSTSSYEASLYDQESKYALYMETIESDDFKRYSELTEYFTNSANAKSSDAEMFKKELKNLRKSNVVKKYYKLEKKYSKIFKEQDRWVSKFYEDFSKDEIDNRWTAKQVVSEYFINGQPYSPIEDKHIYNANNVQQAGGLLKITTKQESKEGLAWDQKYGLIPKVFKYTSGMLSSHPSFRQLFGKFEAKIQIQQSNGTYHAFWMGTDTKTPHLNIIRIEGHNLYVSAFTNNSTAEQKLKYKLKNDYYIFTLLWTNDRITWLINGKKVFETSNFIHDPMYIAFSSGVYNENAVPAKMYVDWVRCFRSN